MNRGPNALRRWTAATAQGMHDLAEALVTLRATPIVKPVLAALAPSRSDAKLTPAAVQAGISLDQCESEPLQSESPARRRLHKFIEDLYHCHDSTTRLLRLARRAHNIEVALRHPQATPPVSAWLELFGNVRCLESDLNRRFICALGQPGAAAASRNIGYLLRGPDANSVFTPALWGVRAHFDLTLGNAREAERDLDHALTEVDRLRVAAPSSIDYMDQAQPLIHQAAMLQLNSGHLLSAFGTWDRGHARFLLDRWQSAGPLSPLTHPTPSSPDDWQRLHRWLPPETAVIAYANLDHHLIRWLIRRSGIAVAEDRPAYASVAVLAAQVGQALRTHPAEEARRTLESLHRVLIGSLDRTIAPSDRIVFLPAADLWRIPFAALINPVSGRCLVQDHPIGIAPSLSTLLAAADLDRRLAAQPIASALIVAAPTLRDPDQPDLSPLPAATIEADLITQLYSAPGTRVLLDEDATPQRVLASLAQADIAHFAVHALSDDKPGAEPSLQLAPDAGRRGSLSSGTILQSRFQKTRLVFLAACHTQTGPLSASEGPLGLAHAFLAAGIPTVIGTLWAVDDEATARLSVRFHSTYRQGADPLTALRAAQLAELASNPRDWTWAAFEALGGNIPRRREQS